MLNSLREWGERRSTRVFALKIAQKRLEFEGVCTVTERRSTRVFALKIAQKRLEFEGVCTVTMSPLIQPGPRLPQDGKSITQAWT